jgi:putative transposase
LEKAHGKFGWRVHAWVLMGNHFHLLLETPEPNLVAGMKWMLGVYSQGWNRRRQRKGHVFQGRYKSVVVNGEEADGSYFKIVADYIHLNPVRSGWVGGNTGKRLRSWRWSSFGAYAGGKVPDWQETGRVLRALRLSEDVRGEESYAGYLEARAKDQKGVVSDKALAELRRGWYLGEATFGEKVLAAIKSVGGARQRSSVGGGAAKAHDEAEAQRLVAAALAELGVPDQVAELAGRGRRKDEKEMVAALVRSHTGISNRWAAARLCMGHEVSVTRAVRRFRDDPKAARKLKALARKLGL